MLNAITEEGMQLLCFHFKLRSLTGCLTIIPLDTDYAALAEALRRIDKRDDVVVTLLQGISFGTIVCL